ncbi:MAG TPA: ABC transporter ATP-binding protein [Thermaerobacter sp.]
MTATQTVTSPGGEPAIETRSLVRRFGKVEALAGIDLVVPRGAVYGFIGPNGAGKTTCLRILAGLLDPTAGTVRVCGLDAVRDRDELPRVVGYMPDFFGVYDDLLVTEYLDFYAACYGLRGARVRRLRDDLLDLVGLAHKAGEMVHSLSRGMKQRLGLARALIHDPEVLLLDEPASGLDPAARIEFRELIRELAAMGKTILVSSHILSELADFSTHVGILDRGRLLVSGPIDQVLAAVRRRSARIRFAVGAAGATIGTASTAAASGSSGVDWPGDEGRAEGEEKEAIAAATGAQAANAQATLNDPAALLARAREVLARMPEVTHVEEPEPRPAAGAGGMPSATASEGTAPAELIVDYEGDDTTLAAINARLVAAGLPVAHLSEVGGSLEEAFLHVVESVGEFGTRGPGEPGVTV